MSKQELEKIKRKIKKIEDETLPNLAQRLQNAARDGDIPENNAYIQIHDEMQIYKAQLTRLKEAVRFAKTIKPKGNTIQVGSVVKLRIHDKIKRIQIVSPIEADPLKNKISYNSPVGKQLIGKTTGQTIKINGTLAKILAVKN